MSAANARSDHERPINLALGEPSEMPPAPVAEAAARAVRDGQARYTPAAGLTRLRELAARDQTARSGIERSVDEVLVTAGGKPALIDALRCLLEPGDEAIVLAPYWPSFRQQVAWAGGRSVVVPPGPELLPDVEGIEDACGPRTRVLLLNDPSNPTSRILDERRLNAVAELAERRDLWIIADQVYDDLVLEGEHRSLLAAAPGVRGRVLAVESFSKRFSMTGYRLGYACGPTELIGAMTRLAAASSTCASAISQMAGIAALSECEAWSASQRDRYRARRDLAWSALSSMEALECDRPEAAFYLFPKLGIEMDDTDFVRVLRERVGVATVPGSAFGAPGHFRLAYAASEADVEEALARIKGLLDSLLARGAPERTTLSHP